MVAKVKVRAIGYHGTSNRSNPPRRIRVLASPRHKRKSTEIIPFGPLATSFNGTDSSSDVHSSKEDGSSQNLSFQEAFGALGFPMVLIVLGCICWTSWLITLSIAPNAAANFLMKTGDLGDGKFWLIPDKRGMLQFASVAGLTLVLVFHVYVLLKILLWRSHRNALQNKITSIVAHWEAAARARPDDSVWKELSYSTISFSWKIYTAWREFTGINGKHRKLWNLCLKFHDFVMLSLLLRDLLEAGTPARIAHGFAAMVALNSLLYTAQIFCTNSTALFEILVDTVFDFAATVIYPLIVLDYCSNNFHYDRAVFAINMKLLPVGSFERRARMFANPAEVALVRATFDSLRILDWTDFFLRISMNFAFSYRCKRIVEVLIELKIARQQPRDRRKTSLQPHSLRHAFSDAELRGHIPQRTVPKLFAVVLVAYSVCVLVVTHQAISTSQSICSAHPQCVVFAYRWHDTGLCPCRVLVDGDPAPRTYYEWTHPIDATDSVKSLAASGTLETLQLINRQLVVLPDELRGCSKLNFICLINCATKELPSWTRELQNLQYLQVEGKQGSDNLGDLAPNLFSHMPALQYLQLGLHQRMVWLPSLDGVPNLSSLILSRMFNFTELPPLAHLTQLERLELSVMKHLPWIPALPTTKPFEHFIIYQGASLCCNGYLGACDLTNLFCKDSICLSNSSLKADPAALQLFQKFSSTVCQPYAGLSQTISPETIQVCNGVPFKQCRLPGSTPGSWVVGMCYNHRMQVLACNPDINKINVRRRQIQDRVGAACDPVEEAWLGCATISQPVKR